jgi:hypothetical protein
MDNIKKWRKLSKKIIPRVLKASLIAIALYFLLFYLPTLIMPSFIPLEYESFIDIFVAMIIFFAFITQLASGTIFQYVFSVARASAFIIFFTLVLNSGVITGNFEGVFILVDLRVFFAMLIGIELLEFGKSLVEAINFLSEVTNVWTPTGAES